MAYRYEKNLVDEFIREIGTSSFVSSNASFTTEFNYSRGRADILILNNRNELVAIEAKLTKWKQALHQAYRNTCFAHYSYVLLPETVAQRAEGFFQEFERRSVGLCYISNGKIETNIFAKRNHPIQPWLEEKAILKIYEGGEYVRKN